MGVCCVSVLKRDYCGLLPYSCPLIFHIPLHLVYICACLFLCVCVCGQDSNGISFILCVQRQADVMIVAGTLTNKMAPALRKVRVWQTCLLQHTTCGLCRASVREAETPLLLLLPLLLLPLPLLPLPLPLPLPLLPFHLPGIRSNARAQVGHLHGELCQRRRLLPLLLLGGAGLRPDSSCGHLRPRLSSHRRGSTLRHSPVAEKDSEKQANPDVVPEVNMLQASLYQCVDIHSSYVCTLPSVMLFTCTYVCSLHGMYNTVHLSWYVLQAPCREQCTNYLK